MATTPFTVFSGSTTSLTNALLAPNSGISVSNIALKASGASAVNFYDGSLLPLGIGSGLLLTSGTTPGTSNTMGWFGVSNNGAGDADINAVVNTVFQTQSYDATTLSFDFTVTDTTATSITFDLVMGSDEYPEWVNAFVDSAVVIVNGVNYALFNHNPNNPLSVVSQNLAAGYFQNNANNVLPIEYDGVSQVLKIVAPINAGGALNHIKIGVADTGDHIYDTGLFIANLSAGNAPGSGIVVAPPSDTGTTGDDNLTGSAKDEYFDLKEGNDTVYAGIGDDIVVGGAGNDVIFGGSGNDNLEGDAGNDDIDGGDGVADTAIYSGKSADYVVTKDTSGSFYKVTSLDGSIDTLKNVETIKFSDGTVTLDVPVSAAPVTTLSTTAPVYTPVVTTVVAPPPPPAVPVNKTGYVFISGVGSVGEQLTASVSDQDGTSVIDYEWFVNGVSVGTGENYTIQSTDLPTNNNDSFIEVTATYVDDAGNSEFLNSSSKKILETQNTGDLVITLMQLDAPVGASVINPLTTLVQNAIELGLTPNMAQAAIKTVLGLPNVNLQSYDAYSILQTNPTDATALAVEKVAVQTAILTSLSDDDSGMKLTSAILNAAQSNQTLDLANADNLATILNVDITGLTKKTYPQPLKEIFDRNDSMAADIADGKDVSSIEAQWQDMLSIQDFVASTSIADLSIHINQAPTGSATTTLASAVEDNDYTISSTDLLTGFKDSDGGTLQVTNLTVDANAGVIVQNGADFTFTPNSNYNGPVELTYNVVDGQYDPYGQEGSISASQFFVVNAVNDAPTGEVLIANNTDATRGITTAQTGDELSVSNSLSDIDGTSTSVLSYQWQRNGVDILGANGDVYTLTKADVNAVISAVAKYTDDQGTNESVASTGTNAIIPVNNAPTGSATAVLAQGTEDTPYTINEKDLLVGFSDVDGDVLSVSSLSATNGQLVDNLNDTWTLTPDANYNGAVALSYNVIDGNGGTLAATQNFSLAAQNDAPTGVIKITGTPTQNQTLTADASTVADADGLGVFSYQWLENGTVIGANSTTYTLTQADVGKTIAVTVSYTDQQGTPEQVNSASTAPIAAIPVVPTPTDGKVINGTKGNDKLVGGTGNDSLFGGKGDDKLSGGAGNDWLTGGKGDDSLTGGTGADHFLFVNRDAEDRILDFNISEGDVIHITKDMGIEDFADIIKHSHTQNNGVQIDFVEGKLLLVGVNVADLTSDQFIIG